MSGATMQNFDPTDGATPFTPAPAETIVA